MKLLAKKKTRSALVTINRQSMARTPSNSLICFSVVGERGTVVYTVHLHRSHVMEQCHDRLPSLATVCNSGRRCLPSSREVEKDSVFVIVILDIGGHVDELVHGGIAETHAE